MRINTGISIRQLVRLAQELASEDHENTEYDRALVELVMDAMGLDHDEYRSHVRKLITDPEHNTLRIMDASGNARFHTIREGLLPE